ncbi:phage Gp19/Gp15/Gp42 family protein [Glutamicibacter halophytocola]|uniref:Phage Gp19/Gp15/Gp42 family protein n=1 Tax=Glutamicibacter halophytocola TaxID=1933880 RepID=A0AA94Y1D7_9MICC|nr:phage Gp19/Gp15/Gp42 family protein [Glutamicibacter halophytocola]UUX60170.1 phage Gp19/Gp15/Gp42 family protein [Glutamicibacter halophytocola]
MAEPFATIEDLKKHWPALPPEDEAEATQKLVEASLVIRTKYPGIDQRIANGELDKDVVTYVVCRMVRRAMDTPEEVPENATQMSFTAGPFSQSATFRNTDGALYLGKSDKELLEPQPIAGGGEFFNLMPR